MITNTKYAGRPLVIQIGDSADPATAVFTTIGGVRAKGYTLNNEPIDITDGDDDVWRKLLEGGIRSLEITVGGLVSNNVAYELMRTKLQTGAIWAYQLGVIADGDSLKAKFQGSSFEENGPYEGAQEFSLTLTSADTVTFTNA